MRCNSSFPTYGPLHMWDQRNGICRLLNSYSCVHVHISQPVGPCPRLHTIYMNFGEDHMKYRKHFAHIMYSVIKQTSTKFLAVEYFSKRQAIRAMMKADLKKAFSLWGATVEAVQLRKVTIPNSESSCVASCVTDVKPELTRSLCTSVSFRHFLPSLCPRPPLSPRLQQYRCEQGCRKPGGCLPRRKPEIHLRPLRYQDHPGTGRR